MKRKRFSEEQIISDATFYNWKAKYGGLSVNEARRLKALEHENSLLKKIVADQGMELPSPERPDQKWSMDFAQDQLADGRGTSFR